jgi:sterol desaturase/sphingolipid hydroxylase (fatty acid hydroxylase superfamily)
LFEAALGHTWITKIVSHLLTYDSYVVLLSWFSALLGAFLTFIFRKNHGYPITIRNFLRFCFPAEILRNRSCRLDALFAVSIRFLWPLIIVPVLITSAAITQLVHDTLAERFGLRPALPDSTLIHVAALVAVVLLADCANFCSHFRDHKIKVLWEFHKVHHAAQFLIPITNRRVHPVQELFDDTTLLLAVGLGLGAITYLAGLRIEDNVVLGMDAYFFANLLSFYHLRHSHIPMAYGWLENVFLSPAQHQLHHSCVERHWDRNFGLLLSCWDKMAGTFVRSEAPDQIILGLPPHYAGRYDKLTQLYLTPFVNVAKMAAGRGSTISGHAVETRDERV